MKKKEGESRRLIRSLICQPLNFHFLYPRSQILSLLRSICLILILNAHIFTGADRVPVSERSRVQSLAQRSSRCELLRQGARRWRRTLLFFLYFMPFEPIFQLNEFFSCPALWLFSPCFMRLQQKSKSNKRRSLSNFATSPISGPLICQSSTRLRKSLWICPRSRRAR